MGFFSKLFGKKDKAETGIKNVPVTKRKDNPDIYHIGSENDRMNWAIEKANLTLDYFKSSLKNPRSDQQYFSIKAHLFDGPNSEHIWLTEPTFDQEGNLFGNLGNAPLYVKNISLGQSIGVDPNHISDWMIIENGRLIGGYTIRAIRDGMPDAEKANFDKSYGLYIDEGEDHFVRDQTTPEGALLCLEDAYDAKDMDRILACKNFKEEAKIFAQQKNLPVDDEVLDALEETLRLSFIQHHQENGFPTFADLKRAFPVRQKINDDLYLISEVCFYPDRTKSLQKHYVHRSMDGWKVLGMEE